MACQVADHPCLRRWNGSFIKPYATVIGGAAYPALQWHNNLAEGVQIVAAVTVCGRSDDETDPECPRNRRCRKWILIPNRRAYGRVMLPPSCSGVSRSGIDLPPNALSDSSCVFLNCILLVVGGESVDFGKSSGCMLRLCPHTRTTPLLAEATMK